MQRIIESRLYDDLPNEVPYNLKVELEYYEVSRDGNFKYLIIKTSPKISIFSKYLSLIIFQR